MKPVHQPIAVQQRASTRVRTFFVVLLLNVSALGASAAEGDPPSVQRVRIAADPPRFVLGDSGTVFIPWGFNYLGEFGKLSEDSWDRDWGRIERDFRDMRQLGANVVRIHLQFSTYMKGPDDFDSTQLDRLRKLLDLGRELGLYLDVTGLSCYRLDRNPAWYDALDESERWEVQARWWKRIAQTCSGHPALVAKYLDFVSVHAFPDKDKVDKAIAALTVYDLGKPLVVEETFPLSYTLKEMDQFIEGGKTRVDGWISHYFGYTIEEHEAGAEPLGTAPDARFGVTVADFLRYWRDKGQEIASPTANASGKGAKKPVASDRDGANLTSPKRVESIVRGSVEQIHIIHAEPHAQVSVQGPDDFQASPVTDSRGGLVLRHVPPGDGYRVIVDGNRDAARMVEVLRPDQHPSAEFYAAQSLEPTHGFVETRDGTLLAYRVALPDANVYGAGPYDLVITYSGYQPSLKTSDGYQNKPFEQFSALGYAVVGVNMRGSSGSGGAFDFMEPLTWLDGYDVVEFLGVYLGDTEWEKVSEYESQN